MKGKIINNIARCGMMALIALVIASCSAPKQDEFSESKEKDIKSVLSQLDREVHKRNVYIAGRNARIDSLRTLRDAARGEARLDYTMAIADLYHGFLTDSALVECRRGERLAGELGAGYKGLVMRMDRLQQMPLVGFSHEAVEEYETLQCDSMTKNERIIVLNAGHQMYCYIAAQFPNYPDEQAKWSGKAVVAQQQLVALLDHDSPELLLNAGDYELVKGNDARAFSILTEAMAFVDGDSNMAARIASLLAVIAAKQGREEESIYYLAESAIADVRSATREVTSLQQLGILLFERGDVMRGNFYLQEALASAVECRATMRMIQTSNAIPVISSAERAANGRYRTRMVVVLIVMIVLTIGLVAVVMRLRKEMIRQNALRERLESANHAKEVYMSEFISLCTVYMNKLNRFCEVAARKISTGATEELYRLTKSGRFAEEQSREFYETFDNAFLHIYPEFIERVNALLREDSQIELAPGEKLNTDLRILAFIRLGVEDSPKIAQALNYSVNTIYSYRNRLRNRAINRDTFDEDIMNIS
jgi:hypothetical protein